MQLLISVRSQTEARSALVGGADIIDAKEPSRGSIGAVSPAVLEQILASVPHDRPASVALGDLRTPVQVGEAVSGVPGSQRIFTYLKPGFAGVAEPDQVGELLRVAVEAVARDRTGIVAVAYADSAAAGSLSPEALTRIAGEAGAVGVLLDTYGKGRGDLFTWLGPSALARFVAAARSAGLLTALAGGLGLEHLSLVQRLGADIVGFRGAVSVGGREGTLLTTRVRAIRQRLNKLNPVFQDRGPSHLPVLGETPGVSAVPGLLK
jgi:(5-formylfuran-3-yl)methyl phosphate synthase